MQRLRAAVATLLGNPMALPPAELEAACGLLVDAARTAPDRLRAAGPAGEVWPAMAHAFALRAEETGASPKEVAPAGQRAPAADVRARYLRVAAASARCVRSLGALAGSSAGMAKLRAEVWGACFGATLLHGLELERVVRDHDVLITGETGTGKELVARAIAAGLPAKKGTGPSPFAQINAAAVPDTLIESELFGHTKGAFTGAVETRAGVVRSADGGSLFLDEVGDLPLSAQVKLLRVIETDEVQPVGADVPYRVDVRYIAATHRDLTRRIEEGLFRVDLYQRLAGVTIRVPALRERPEDIEVIGTKFLAEITEGVALADVSSAARWLSSAEARVHPWPGNVRELRNVLRNLVLGLPTGMSAAPGAREEVLAGVPDRVRLGQASVEELESWYLSHVLHVTGGNVAAAARILGVDRSTVHRKRGR